jgi:thymidylate synthase (FAD)
MIGSTISVLDHGFVRLVDYMGDDQAIVQAARVSYGRGTKRAREDRGLLRYLLRHHHTTPFEMCEIKVHVKLPIFVARQWIRHRTACLTGDTKLYFDLPNAIRKGGRSRRSASLERLHRLWHEGTILRTAKKKPCFVDRIDAQTVYTVPQLAALTERREETIRTLIRVGAVRAERRFTTIKAPSLFIRGSDWHKYAETSHENRIPGDRSIRRAQLRMCDESSGEILHTRITDIWSTGTKPVFKVSLANGYSISMTKDHRCLTSAGWKTLEEATGLRHRPDDGVTWRDDAPAFAVNGNPAHRDSEWLKARRAEGLDLAGIAVRAGISTHTIRKSLQRFGLQYSAQERAKLSGLAQRGQRRTVAPRAWTETALANIRKARSGENSNFWKGGVTEERANIGRWTREHAGRVHVKYSFRCVLCAGSERLCAHHLDPVWNNPGAGMEFDNLISLCGACHRRLHARNLELALLLAVESGSDLFTFWNLHPTAAPRPIAKTLPTVRKLVRTWSKVVKIEYAGEQPTYDVAVEGPYHNFVANGFIVHNSVNEYSGRYSILDREFYVPAPDLLAGQAKNNRQGRGDAVSPERAAQVLALLKQDAELAYSHYEDMLGGAAETQKTGEETEGIARELARINLPVSFYTQWYWKIDLHNLLRFIALRADAHAQYEIRVYAEALATLTKAWVPDVYEAFVDYQLEGASLSRMEVEALKRMLKGETPDLAALGLSAREQAEFRQRFDLT